MNVRWQKFISIMAEADYVTWKTTSSRVAWYYRKGYAQAPDPLNAWVTMLPDAEEWAEVRKEINRRRRNRLAKNKRHPTSDRLEADKRRREYMRTYMAAYRARNKNKGVDAELTD